MQINSLVNNNDDANENLTSQQHLNIVEDREKSDLFPAFLSKFFKFLNIFLKLFFRRTWKKYSKSPTTTASDNTTKTYK